MKTREEVLNHLLENGYNKKAINKICGFMVARELKTLDEKVKILKGDKTFEDFYRWYYDATPKVEEECDECYCPRCILESLIEDITELLLLDMEMGKDELVERRALQLDLLLSLSEVDNED